MEKVGRYTFVVGKRANKLEVKKAVEEFYGVKVSDVNTSLFLLRAKLASQKQVFFLVASIVTRKLLLRLLKANQSICFLRHSR